MTNDESIGAFSTKVIIAKIQKPKDLVQQQKLNIARTALVFLLTVFATKFRCNRYFHIDGTGSRDWRFNGLQYI